MLLDFHTHHLNSQGIYNLIVKERNELPSQFFSAGIHPWYMTPTSLPLQYTQLRHFLSMKNCLALGEIGLDRLCDTPWDLQVTVLEKQLEIAAEFKKPIIFHCVKAQQDLLLRKKGSPLPWIIHGFNQKTSIGNAWLQQGCLLSFGKALLHEDSNASRFIRETPLDKLFLETDDAEQSIETIYKAASERLHLPLEKLAAILQDNYHRIFNLDHAGH